MKIKTVVSVKLGLLFFAGIAVLSIAQAPPARAQVVSVSVNVAGGCDDRPTCTPTPSRTPTATGTSTPTSTSTPSPTPTNTPSPVPTDTPTATKTPTPTNTPTPSNTPTPTMTLTPFVDLSGSRKLASASMISTGQVLTYTVVLSNSGNAGVHVGVSDRIPPETTVITSSLTGGAKLEIYFGRTYVTWNGTVPGGGSHEFSFSVTVTSANECAVILNQAYLLVGDSYERVLEASTRVQPCYTLFLPLITR